MSTGREVGVVVVGVVVVGVGVGVVVVEFLKRRRNKNDVPVCQEQRSLLEKLLSHSAHLLTSYISWLDYKDLMAFVQFYLN